MNQAVKDKWLTALASDEFTHGRGQLVIDDYDWSEVGEVDADEPTLKKKHCCLGVLCVLAKREGIIDEIPETNESDFRAGLYLPEAVEDWAGLEYSVQEGLAEKNDEPTTFDYSPVIELIKAL